MKKTRLLKSLLVGIVSIIFIVSVVSYVNAADDDMWLGPEIESNNNTNSGTVVTGNQQSSDDVIDPIDEVTVTGNNSSGNNSSGSFTTELDENLEETENNNTANQMPHTGIEDNSLLFVVITLGLIVAGYSYKKLSDYNNL